MADTNLSAPQADFHLLSQSFITAASETEKLQNLPAIVGVERIIAEVQQMRLEMRQETQQMRQENREHIARLEERIMASYQNLLTAISTSDLNNAARVQNSHALRQSDQLSPFLNPLTGAIITGFPTSSAEIGRMAEQDMDAILQQLGLQTAMAATSLAMKRRKLRAHIGLTSLAENGA